jgi:hypothetical protein
MTTESVSEQAAEQGAWRPLRRRLPDEAVAFHEEQRAAGLTPLLVHLMLVNTVTERGRTACGGGLGEWVTGDADQVTCRPCIEQVHA